MFNKVFMLDYINSLTMSLFTFFTLFSCYNVIIKFRLFNRKKTLDYILCLLYLLLNFMYARTMFDLNSISRKVNLHSVY